MNDKDLRNYEMILRVRDYGLENAASFPPTSFGGELFAKVTAAAAKLEQHIAQQVSGRTSKEQGSATKASARSAVLSSLGRLRRTARSMALTMPGIDTKFRIPGKLTDQELIGTAQAAAAAALERKADFLRFAMPADFIEDLNDQITEFQSALTRQQTGKGHQVMATAGIDDTLDEALSAVRQLDAIVRNTFHDDAARLAGWTSARHVERPARTKKSPGGPASDDAPDEPAKQ